MSGTDGIRSLQHALGSLALNETKTTKTGASTLYGASSVETGPVDQANVSLGGLAAQSGTDGDIRLAKVAQLKAAIANGTYAVPATDVADKLVETLLNGR